jgi:cation transport ATPase
MIIVLKYFRKTSKKSFGVLQNKEDIVAMKGNGVNDAPIVAKTGVVIAIGSRAGMAAETADVI